MLQAIIACRDALRTRAEAGGAQSPAARLAKALLELDLPADKDWLQWIVKTADGPGARVS